MLNCKRDFDIIAVSGGGISWAMCKSVLLTKNLWTVFLEDSAPFMGRPLVVKKR